MSTFNTQTAMDEIQVSPIDTTTGIRKTSSGHEPRRRTKAIADVPARTLTCPAAGVTPLAHRKFPVIGQSERLGTCKDLQIYICATAALITSESGENYLMLPDGDKWAADSEWVDSANDKYDSNALYIRRSYVDIGRLIIEEAMNSTAKRNRMTLSGTSGTGKSFFIKYFVWKLLHPEPGVPIPDVIIWKHTQGGKKGGVYAFGSFYTVVNIPLFLPSDECEDLLYRRNAWIIYDGEPPEDPPRYCNILVVSSPGKLMVEDSNMKEHQKATDFNIYLPPWSLSELLEVGRSIHQLSESELSMVTTKYTQFGGIARYVFSRGYSVTD
jgi:hypothetical protein